MERQRTGRWLLYFGVILIAIMLIVLLGPGISSDKPDANDSKSSDGTTAPIDPVDQRIRLLLDGFPNSSHAYIFAADMNGYFREQDLALEIVTPAESVDALALVGSGEADLALVPGPQVLISRAEQVPVVSIAAVVRRPLVYLTVPRTSPIHSPKNLLGKKVGYARYPFYEAVVRTMVSADDDTDPYGMTFENVGTSYTSIFLERKADAVIGPSIHHERLVLEKRGVRVRTIEPALYGVPVYYDSVLAAREQSVADNPELYKKIWNALSKGQQYVVDHPDQAVRFVMGRQNKNDPLDPDIEKESLEMLLPLMDAGEDPFGYQSEEAWSDVKNWLADIGMIDKSFDSDHAFVNLTE